MARLNVEDDFWTHPRYRALSRLLGDEDKAAGMCFRAWRLAQKYWAEKKTIPFDVWELEGLEPLTKVGLAERRDEGVYCRGSEKHFEWYAQRVEAGRLGGLKSVESRAEKYGSAQPPGRNLGSKQNRSTASKESNQDRSAASEESKRESNPLTLTLTPSPISLSSKEESSSAERRPPRSPRLLAELWNSRKAAVQPKVDLAKFKSGSPRWRKAQTRLAEHDIDYWQAIIDRIAASPFCRGENDRHWIATFDFLLRPETHVKADEGQYDDRDGSAAYDWEAVFREGSRT